MHMTASEVERIRRQWGWSLSQEATDDDGFDNWDSLIQVRRVSAPTVPHSGVRYQRCGGGRRVIRKTSNGSY